MWIHPATISREKNLTKITRSKWAWLTKVQMEIRESVVQVQDGLLIEKITRNRRADGCESRFFAKQRISVANAASDDADSGARLAS